MYVILQLYEYLYLGILTLLRVVILCKPEIYLQVYEYFYIIYYSYFKTCNNTLLISFVDFYMNTIGDMQNEMNFFHHYNEIEYNHYFEIFF